MSSSGLVSDPTSSDRAAQSTSSPPIAPLDTESMRPLPVIRSPCQVTSAVRSVAIRASFEGRVHNHRGTGLDQLGEGAAVVGRVRQLREGRLIHFFYTRAREKLRGDDPVRAVRDLVERDRGVYLEVVGRGAGSAELARKRHCEAGGVRSSEQFLGARLPVAL